MKHFIRFLASVVMVAAFSGCSLSGLVDGTKVSSETRDPAVFRTPQGALTAYRGAHVLFATAISAEYSNGCLGGVKGIVCISGLLTDELRAVNMAANFPTDGDAYLDSRSSAAPRSGEAVDLVYAQLHHVRAVAQEARGMMQEFVPGEWRDLYAHLYAIEGYADILLADFFCSGIPLSRINYKGDYIVTRGYTTTEVYEQALVLFDSAESYIRDSTDLVHFINIGRGRALVAIGQYARAAEVVQRVPNTYRYEIPYSATFPKQTPRPANFVIADGDGNGIPFISDHDPRASLPALLDKTAPLIFASGIEARLIAVEAAVHSDNDDWMAGLNALRTTCAAGSTCPIPAPPGIGKIGGLAPLIDSTQSLASDVRLNKRIDILFHERAYWLFLTGHRQGDLRRLVRQYGRNEQSVYPSGMWGSKGFTGYGTNTNFAPPDNEKLNSLYAGCIHVDA